MVYSCYAFKVRLVIILVTTRLGLKDKVLTIKMNLNKLKIIEFHVEI